MKKMYNSPKTIIVELKMRGSLLQALSIKDQNATSAGMSRGSDRNNSWDEDDDY